MGGFLAGMGAFAGGVSQGMERGQQMAARQQQISRQKTLQDADDKNRAALEEATNAGRAVLQGYAQEHAKTQGPVNNYMRLGGSDESMPDQSAIDSAPAAVPFKATQQQLMSAAQARTDKLFEMGEHEMGVRQWAQDEQMRGQLRKQAVEKGMLAYKAGGDIKPLLSGVYSTIDDGYDLGNVEQINNPDAKAPPAWNVERVNTRTGEKTAQKMGAEQIDDLVSIAMDPQRAAKYALMEKLAGYRGDQQRLTNNERGAMSLDQIDRRSEGAAGVAEIRGSVARDVAEIRGNSARDVANIRISGTIKAAEIRGAGGGRGGGSGGGSNGVQSIQTSADGTQYAIMRQLGEDGELVRKKIVGDDGKPIVSIAREKMVNQVAGTVGKSLGGFTATPEANRARADKMLPQPSASPTKPRPSLSDFDPSKPKPSLDSFQR